MDSAAKSTKEKATISKKFKSTKGEELLYSREYIQICDDEENAKVKRTAKG